MAISRRKFLFIAFIVIMTVFGDFVHANDEIKNSTDSQYSDKVFKEKPIVIHTQAVNYDNPTLDDYEKCQANLDNCLEICATEKNEEACRKECPICPILINHDVVVQGLNDTNYKVPVENTATNTTNIIRLTNEIRNVIQNTMGNITTRNENNVQIHNNHTSHIGGQFGLGYNQNGSCCIVVRKSSKCKGKSTKQPCEHKRHRVCSESKCKAAVMYAKQVTHCNDYIDDGDNDCYNTISYVPYQARQRRSRCHYTQNWPFVMCNRRQQRPQHSQYCQHCMRIPYGQILAYGMPRQCQYCYRGRQQQLPHYNSYSYYNQNEYLPPIMYPYAPTNGDESDLTDDFNFDNDYLINAKNGWKTEAERCFDSNGRTVDCNNLQNEENDITSGDYDSNINVIQDNDDNFHNNNDDNYDDADDYDDLGTVEAVRRRRRQQNNFVRSIYSHRNKLRY